MYPGKSPAKFMSLPLAVYATFQYDAVVKGGKHAGISQYVGYSANAKSMLSLSIVDLELSEPGAELVVALGVNRTRGDRRSRKKRGFMKSGPRFAPAPFLSEADQEKTSVLS